jgi:hypothetical protein
MRNVNPDAKPQTSGQQAISATILDLSNEREVHIEAAIAGQCDRLIALYE